MGAEPVPEACLVENGRVIRSARMRRLGDDGSIDCSTVMSYINPITNTECLFGASGTVNNSGPTVSSVVSSQVGGEQDPCTAGGLLCPQPGSPGAGLNPCCWASASSADATGNPTSTTSILLWGGGALALAYLFFGQGKGRR